MEGNNDDGVMNGNVCTKVWSAQVRLLAVRSAEHFVPKSK
jgi:hypothetical protein